MGKLIDADICLEKAWQNFYKQEDEHEKNIDDYDISRDRFYEQSGFECCQQTIVNEQPVEAIPIPKGATNGDMMIAIYGIVDIEVNERSVRLFPKDGGQLWVTRDWWNAEFKEPIKALEQEPKTGHCKDCKWWKDSDGQYRRGCGAESQCPINTHAVYCGEGYCYMFEPQDSEVDEGI